MSNSVLICVSHGFHVRNILYSRLYQQLIQRAQVTVLMPDGVVVPPEDQHLLRGATVVTLSVQPHRFENAFLFLRKNVFAGRERTQTFNLISELERQKHPLLY